MKAEINNENKSKFFALYWGQETLELVGYEELVNPYVAHLNNDGRRPKLNAQILLKPLSQISDEDAIDVAKLYGWDLKDPVLTIESQINTIKYKLNLFNEGKINVIYIVCDYLRSKGYALPWMGLSVKEMIEAGWIELIER